MLAEYQLMIYAGFGGSNAVIMLEEGSDISHKVIKIGGCKHGSSRYSETFLGDEAQVEAQNRDGIDQHHNHDSVKRLYVFSARSESSLSTYLASFMEYIDGALEYDTFMKDLCFTLGQRRTHYSYRAAIPADSLTSLKDSLLRAKPKKSRTPIFAFVFTGQGAQ